MQTLNIACEEAGCLKKRDWSDCKLTIGCPGDEDSIIIPIHGEKETDINKL